jgi:hypothetical protein
MKTKASFLLLAVGLCSASFGSPIHPITDGTLLYGASQSGKWIDDKTTAHRLHGPERYTFYGFTSRVGTGIGSKPTASTDAQCSSTIDANVSHVPANAVIGIAAPWNALPRKPHVESVDRPLYKKIVADYVAANGISDPKITVTQVVRGDIDGNGQDADVIAARYETPGNGADAYIVVVRTTVHGHAVTVPLLGDVADKDSFATKAEIKGMYDLKGDGHMEVVVQANYNDSEMTNIYDVQGSHAKNVLNTGCGV